MEASSKLGSLPKTYVGGFHDKEAVSKMKYSYLGQTGLAVSAISLGCAAFGCCYGDVDEETAIEVIHKAIKSGINYIDTAPWYGQGRSEEVLGKALATIPREAYYISTKVGRYELDPRKMFDFSADRVAESVDKSLRLLKLDYVDILQIHDIDFSPNIDILVNETLPATEKVVRAGKARFIGLTSYTLDTPRQVVERSSVKIDTVLSFSRCCLHDCSLLDTIPWYNTRGIGVINAAATSMGLLTSRGPQKWHCASPLLRGICREAVLYCEQEGVDIAKLATWFSLQQQGVATLLASAHNVDILNSNLAVATEAVLSEKENEVLDFILKTFFKDMPETNWVGVEVAKYQKKLKNLESK